RHVLHRAVPRTARRCRRRVREERALAARTGAGAAVAPGARHHRRQRVLPPLASAVGPALPVRPGAPVPAAERVHAHGGGSGDAGVALATHGRVLPVSARSGAALRHEGPGPLETRARACRKRGETVAQSALTFCACRPFGPRLTSNCTFCPSARVRKPSLWMAV